MVTCFMCCDWPHSEQNGASEGREVLQLQQCKVWKTHSLDCSDMTEDQILQNNNYNYIHLYSYIYIYIHNSYKYNIIHKY